MTENMKTVPARCDVAVEDTWDLSSLFPNDDAWMAAFEAWEKRIPEISAWQGKLADGPGILAKCLDNIFELDRLAERIGTYAGLRTAEDAGDGAAMGLRARFMNAASRAAEAESFLSPEVLEMSEDTLNAYLDAPEMAPYRLWLQRLVEEKPHTLSKNEERLLALQIEMAQTASEAFDQLTDVDMKFGPITDHDGDSIELSHASFSALLHGPRREVRRQAFHQFYSVFEGHKNTLAAVYAGSVHGDIYHAKVRNFPSAREAVLFSERIPVSVYDNLIVAVRTQLPKLHEYYDIRRRLMKLDDIHMYDTYVPIFEDAKVDYPWERAVEMVLEAVRPLGENYGTILRRGLTEQRWCDRYENRGKNSGAFSCGSFDGFPYILMNYKPTVLDSIFTLAHEAGHSMHSYFSAHTQPFPYYGYELFVAEVASTFNEQLLQHSLLAQISEPVERLKLVNREIDEIRGTIFRQTMFAEFERDIHAAAESGEPLTLDLMTSTYSRLLRDYFGPNFALDEDLSLECLRIPHFYSAFYVYKYATGLSAALALSQRVLNGGQAELDDYLGFLSGGGSRTPLELLQRAGVDMSRPEPVQTALETFGQLVDELGKC